MLRGPGGPRREDGKNRVFVVFDRGEPQLPDAFTASKNVVPSQSYRILKFRKNR